MKAKIVFFGSDKYGSLVLESLKKTPGLEIVKIIQNKEDLNGLESLEQPDLGIVASFGSLIPEKIINWPKMGLLNLHPSLLPKYRGPTPIPTAILNGEKETGLTIIKIDKEIDHGPIIHQFKEIINDNETSDDLLKRLFKAGAEALVTILPDYLEGKIKPQEQDHQKATFTEKLTRESGRIDWLKPIDYQQRFIQAMLPWPGAWREIKLKEKDKETKRFKILKAHLEKQKLVLDLVQLEGKKPVTWKQFLEGYPKAKIVS
jgi:methionyl-tRNA formyltransferase